MIHINVNVGIFGGRPKMFTHSRALLYFWLGLALLFSGSA